MKTRTERELRQHNARQQMLERRRVVHRLQQALAAGDLSLQFQPIISMSTGLAQGAEAVLRLNHSRGLMPAGHLLRLAEQADVIIDIGRWMLREACWEAARWPVHSRISLAFSRQYLRSGQLALHLLEALHLSGLAAERLELLITEPTLLDENEDTIFALKAVRGLGVKLALDQFGTGYVSLAPLKPLKFSALRLEKSLMQILDGDAAVLAIIRPAVEAGHALGCSVVADGVENTAQYELLRHAGADEGQGAFFGRAVSGAGLAAMFRQAERNGK